MEQIEKKKDLIIFSNGPGEVSTWVLPVVEAVQKRKNLSHQYRIILIIHPCQFASGTEYLVAKKFDGVETVIGPKEYLKILFTGFGKKKFRFKREGILFSLGGDLMHPVLFNKRIKGQYTLYAYTNNPGWDRHYEKIFIRSEYIKDKSIKRGVSNQKLYITGDLVYSSLKFHRKREDIRSMLDLSQEQSMLAFMPGSRDFEVMYMLPVFLKVIDVVTDRLKDVKAFLIKSPYVSFELIKRALSKGGEIKEVESIAGTLVQSEQGQYRAIEFSKGKRIRILEEGLEYWGKGIDFAVTLPGTNTIQLAYRKIPSLVVAPLNKPELIPVEGIFGFLKWIPWIGKVILEKAVFHYLKKFQYASLPNMYVNEEIFPELFGIIQTSDITDKIIEILENTEHKKIKEKLFRFKPDHNPVGLIVQEVFDAAVEQGEN